MPRIQNGGLLLTKKMPSTFHAIYEMIKNAREIKPFYMDSLKGFVFILNIDADKSLFYTLNPDRSNIDVKVESIIFKFAFVSDVPRQVEPDLPYDGFHIHKESDVMNSVINEVAIQQHIYLESIKNTGSPIVPGVADFSYFETDQSFVLLDLLVDHCKNAESKQVFTYIKTRLAENPAFPKETDGFKLSLISMENAISYVQLQNVLVGKYILEERKHACMATIAQMIRLFLQFGVVHCDAHDGNILVKRNLSGKQAGNNTLSSMDAKIIDFGSFINLYDDMKRPLITNQFSIGMQHELKKLIFSEAPSDMNIEKLLLRDYKLFISTTDETIKNRLVETLKTIFHIIVTTDLAYQKNKFGKNFIQGAAAFKYLKLLNIEHEYTENVKINMESTESDYVKDKYMDIVRILYEIIAPENRGQHISGNTIDAYKKEKRFATIDARSKDNNRRSISDLISDIIREKPVKTNRLTKWFGRNKTAGKRRKSIKRKRKTRRKHIGKKRKTRTRNKCGGTQKNVRFDPESVKPEDMSSRIFHELEHDTSLVRNDVKKYMDAVRNDKKMTKQYEDIYSDIIGSSKWLKSENPKWDRIYDRIARVSTNTSNNSKLGGK
jgi:hypothetical protein